LEQAPTIGGYDGLHVGKCIQLPISHGDGYFGCLHGEESPEPTTLLIHLPWDDLGPGGFEKPYRLLLHLEFPESVATVVVR
jgi:hypothetical protein